MGSVEHMAPETLKALLKQPQIAEQSVVSAAADIFSLGVLLKGLVLGRLPFAFTPKDAVAPSTLVQPSSGLKVLPSSTMAGVYDNLLMPGSLLSIINVKWLY